MTDETHLQPASDPAAISPTPADNPRVSNPVPPYERLLFTYREASLMLGISESWLRKQGARGTVPTVPFGRAVRFSEADLQEIIRVRRRPARPAGGRRSKF